MKNYTELKPSVLALVLLVSFGSISAVLFTPALPLIAQQLGLSQSTAQLTITLYLVGYSFGFLPYGPLSERFGRKPATYLGVSVAILGCLLVLLVEKFPFFSLFLVGRLLNALGTSVGVKIAFTMVGDSYKDEKATKVISYLMLSFAIAPSLAIGLGGALTNHFGWMSCFYFQTAYSLFILVLCYFLPETQAKRDRHALNLSSIVAGFRQKITNAKLILCSLLMGGGASIIYLFAAEAPFIGIEQIGLSPQHYGLLNFIPASGLVIGSFLVNALKRNPPLASIRLGTFTAATFTALMLLLFLLGVVNPWTLFLPMALIYIGESLVYANASSLVMSHAQNKSYASATMGFLTMGSCIVILSINEWLASHHAFVMPLIFMGIVLFMFLLLQMLKKKSVA
jgi:DHA1 family bicyclomycin/chloramphenicol resistance-like MFS transporter